MFALSRLIFPETKILPLAGNELVVNTVEESNQKQSKSLEQMVQLEKKWRTPGETDPWVKKLLNNSCSKYLKNIQRKDDPLYLEIFVMDKYGCLVAASAKTTDYWQGDEAKFIKSFNKNLILSY